MNENGHAPLTRADLESAFELFFKRVVEYVDERFAEVGRRFQQVDERFQQVDERFQQVDERLNKLSEHVDERVYDTETNLLRAFREFQNAQDIRLRKIEGDLGNLDTSATLRLAQLEASMNDLQARVMQLEDRPR